jgi:hypothetical protein
VGSDVITSLIDRDASGYDVTTGLAAQLVTTLGFVDRWYTAVAGLADSTWLRPRESSLAGKVWTHAHEAALPLPVSVDNDVDAVTFLADVGDSGLSVDWSILRAAFDPSHPISSPPLLYIVGDALLGTSQRLEEVTPIHDVACGFAGCAPASAGGLPRASAASDAWLTLASVGDSTALATALARSTSLASAHPPLISALQAMHDQHVVLEQAWAAVAGGLPMTALTDPLATVPTEAEELTAIVSEARKFSDSYAKTGLFRASHARLSSAVLKQDQLLGFIDYGVTELDGATSAYAAARLATVNDLLEQTRTAGQTQSVNDRAADGLLLLSNQLGNLDGLRAREQAQHASVQQFTSAFEDFINSGAFDANAAYQISTVPPTTISPQDAHFPLNGTFDLNSIRATVLTLTPGQILTVDMPDATWTPSCAVSVAQILGPQGAVQSIDFSDAVTGPEGYVLTYSGSQFGVHNEDTSDASTASVEACVGFKFTDPLGGATSSAGLIFDASLNACVGKKWSHTVSDSGGNDTRVNASFPTGLHLPFVPVPDAPVGSLLAVITPHNQPANILDIRIVNRRDAILMPSIDPALSTSLDVNFLVNDISGPCPPPANDSLLLSMKIITPAGLVAQDVGAAMAQSLTQMEGQAPSILAQGGLLPNDASALRTGAWARLTTLLATHGFGLQGLPLELKTLYDAWIENEIASLGRRGEIDRVQKEIARQELDLNGLAHDLENDADQARLLSLIPRLRLRDLAGVRLHPAIASLGTTLTDYTAPIFELRDPTHLTSFQSTATADLNALVGVDFARPIDEVAGDLRQFAVAVRSSVAAAQFELPTDARRTIVLAFPRDPNACDGLCDEFRAASPESSDLVWQGIQGADHVARLVVQPSDLYAASGGNARLSCHDLAPVVRRASVYVLNPLNTSTNFQALGRELPAVAGDGGASFTFPRSGSVFQLTADTPDGVELSLPVINGPGGDVITNFGTSPDLGAGAGIAPFSTFDVDFTSFFTDPPLGFLDDSVAVLLVLEVERNVSTDSAFVPGTCQDAVAP